MTVQVIVELPIKEGRVDDFRDFMVKILPHTRSHPGCVSIEFVKSQDNPHHILVMEKWNSRKDYEDYYKWRMETGALAEMADTIDGEPTMRVFDPAGL